MKVYLANVGVNQADAKRLGLKSPVFPNGTFEFIPIKEKSDWARAPGARRYRELRCVTGIAGGLGGFVPSRIIDYAAHDDPDFVALTYGDVGSSRAANLRQATEGDHLWFLARLWTFEDGAFTGDEAFYLVGRLVLTHNVPLTDLQCISALPDPVRRRIEQNAHWIRLSAGASEGARVLVGDPLLSARFERAIQVTPAIAGHFFAGEYDPKTDTYSRQGVQLMNQGGTLRTFKKLGSITRTVQGFLDSSVPDEASWIQRLEAVAAGGGAVLSVTQSYRAQ